MKKVLIIAAALGISASAALAECGDKTRINASIPVDREFKTASITPPTEPAQKPTLILKKTDRLPGATAAVVASPQSAMERM